MSGVPVWVAAACAAGAALLLPVRAGIPTSVVLSAGRVDPSSGAAPSDGSTRARPGPLVIGAAGAGLATTLQVVLPGEVRPFWVVAGVAGALVARTAWDLRANRLERRATTVAVTECCETLAAELASGRTPVAALESAASGWVGLGEVAEAFHLGLDVPTALRRLAARPGAGELRLVAAAWQVGQESGQGLAAALGRVSDTLQARRRTARVVESELASARATARMVAVLPAVALLMGVGSGGDPVGFLLTTTVGNLCAGAGLVLTALGLGWIELLAERAAR